jgi:molybdopterin biosynthesis enzyme
LPGNPVSSMVSFELFCRPGLRRMAGHRDDDLDRPVVQAVVDEDLRRRPDGKVHFARVACRYDLADGTYRVASSGAQGSHQMAAMAAADALAELPDGGTVAAGDTVQVRLLRP